MDFGTVVFFGVVLAVVTSVIAQLKGYSGIKWFILGLIAPGIALFILILMPRPEVVPTPDTHVKCPDCKELILKEARVCKHCGCKLIPSA